MNTTTKNNKLIAEFMGYIDNGCSEEGFLIDPKTNHDKDIKSLKYRSSWNWLIPVVEKIESFIFDEDNSYNVTIGGTNYCVIQDSLGGIYEDIQDSGETKLETVYKAVVEFIKWYNQQQK